MTTADSRASDRIDNRRESLRTGAALSGFEPYPVATSAHCYAPCLLHAYRRRLSVCPVCTASAAERKAWRQSQVPKPRPVLVEPDRSGSRGVRTERCRAVSDKALREQIMAMLRRWGGLTVHGLRQRLDASETRISRLVVELDGQRAIESAMEPWGNGHQVRVWRARGQA